VVVSFDNTHEIGGFLEQELATGYSDIKNKS